MKGTQIQLTLSYDEPQSQSDETNEHRKLTTK